MDQQSSPEASHSPRTSPRRPQLTEFEKGLIVGLAQPQMSAKAIASHLQRHTTTITTILARYDESGETSRHVGSGRKRKTSETTDRRIVRAVKIDRTVSGKQLKKDLDLDDVSERTIRNRIREVGGFESRWSKK
jgi:IS30 family transposase